MVTVDFLHQENPPTWARVEPATIVFDDKKVTSLKLKQQPCLPLHLIQKNLSNKQFKNPLQLSHQIPPGDIQTSKKMRRAGWEATGTQREKTFTSLELHRSQISTSKPRQGRLESPRATTC
ncbi:hypothetical protein TNCV_146931 [Trichonephila clavipes]|nr:hypothetical protein TNCV_146931 [Trichonephila clavipes]